METLLDIIERGGIEKIRKDLERISLNDFGELEIKGTVESVEGAHIVKGEVFHFEGNIEFLYGNVGRLEGNVKRFNGELEGAPTSGKLEFNSE